MGSVEVKRQIDPRDLAAVTALIAAAERADGHRPIGDQLWMDLVQGGAPGFAGILLRRPGTDHLVAYAQVSPGNSAWTLELVIHPEHRAETAALAPRLLRAALEVVAADGGGRVHWWVFEPTAVHDEVAASVGLVPGRTLFQMRCDLPVAETTDVPTRPFRVGEDEDRWLEVNNRAFRDHPEQGGWDPDTLARREREPWFDPSGLLLHERDGRVAAFCWTKVHRDHDPVVGEIYVIAVDPDFHGLGLGRALVLAGLDHLASEGVPIGLLYVDGGNDVALKLYRSIGFVTHRTDRAYTGEVG